MIFLSYDKLEDDMDSYFDKVIDDSETIVVETNGKNAVIISEKVYNNILENLYILQDKANYDWIMESISQLSH